MATKKTNDKDEIVNNTDTELELLSNIEKSFYKANPSSQKRNTEKSRKWFSKYVPKNYGKVRSARILKDRDLWANSISPGSLYLFEYSAKHHDTLPVWDRMPLVFFFDSFKSKAGDQMVMGINVHYLPPALRLVAFRALLKTRNEKRFRKSTRLNISWSVLKALSNSKYFEHSVKMYRVDHVKSKFIKMPAKSWELVLWLPLARWQKGSSSKAWKMK